MGRNQFSSRCFNFIILSFEKKTEKFYQTAIPTVTSYLLGSATGGILRTPARNGSRLTTKAVTEVVTYGQGEFTQTIMEECKSKRRKDYSGLVTDYKSATSGGYEIKTFRIVKFVVPARFS